MNAATSMMLKITEMLFFLSF